MRELVRYEKYSRKDIHDVFSPDTNFTPQAGSWGLQGIIRVPGTQHDYIFLVTYGKKQSGHEFDENIDENGILTWQSQPSHNPKVVSSSLTPATTNFIRVARDCGLFIFV